MQDIEPEHHLLQRAAGHLAHEDAVGQALLKARNNDAVTRMLEIDPAFAQRHESTIHAASGERGLQALSMPARVVGGDGYVHLRLPSAERLLQQRRIERARAPGPAA